MFFLPVHNPKYCSSVPEGLKETRKAFFQERETKPRFPGSSPWTKFWLIFIFTTYHCHYHLVSNLNPKEANWLLKEMSFCNQSVCFLNCCKLSHNIDFRWYLLVLWANAVLVLFLTSPTTAKHPSRYFKRNKSTCQMRAKPNILFKYD